MKSNVWRLRLIEWQQDCSPEVQKTFVFGNGSAAKAMHANYNQMFIDGVVHTLAVLEEPA